MFQKTKKLLITMICTFSICASFMPAHAFENTLLDNVNADYAIVIDRDTGQVLAEKNADERMYPASMTKMMTAILAIENLTDLNQTVTITEEMLAGLMDEDASVVGFIATDTPTVQDLLYGIALPSGADACNAVAYTISGSVDAFVELMNQKAQQIGMTNTHFMNVTGLHDDNHYSTARDMATLLNYCLSSETFQTVFSTHEYTTSSLNSYPAGITMTNTIWESSELHGINIDGLIGGKTGFTYPAAYCLASWEDINDMHLVSVVAHCETSEAITYAPHLIATNTLFNQLSSWNKQTLLTTDTEIASITVSHIFSKDDTVSVHAPGDITLDLPQGVTPTITCTLPDTVEADSAPQNITGDLSISVDDTILYTTKIMVKIQAEENLFDKIALYFKKHL